MLIIFILNDFRTKSWKNIMSYLLFLKRYLPSMTVFFLSCVLIFGDADAKEGKMVDKASYEAAEALIQKLGINITPNTESEGVSEQYILEIRKHVEAQGIEKKLALLISSIHTKEELDVWAGLLADPVGRAFLQKFSAQTQLEVSRLVREESVRAIKCTPLEIRPVKDRAFGVFTSSERRLFC